MSRFCRYIIIMKCFFAVILFALASGVFAAPLDGGYSLAPSSSASEEEKTRAYYNARQRVIDKATQYLGIPYLYGGVTVGGLDCSGFICLSFQETLGVSLPRSASGIYTWAERVPVERAQPGDFLFFCTGTPGIVNHVGLYLGSNRFIHAASDGPQTGVIYSSLNEQYYIGTFAGAGRAFPEIPAGFNVGAFSEASVTTTAAAGRESRQEAAAESPAEIREARQEVTIESPSRSRDSGKTEPAAGGQTANSSGNNKGRLLAGAAAAPVWNSFIKGGDLVRGFSSQLFFYIDTYSFSSRMVFGFELRPEYDGALEVFRLPITFSWGPSEKIRVFLGPVLSFGDASPGVNGDERRYANWLNVIGFTAAPFVITSPKGDFAPYLELAWQSYILNSKKFDLASDFSAGFRFSTGIRWLIDLRS